MKVESEWGKGTTIILTLPIIETEGGKKRETVEGSLRGKKGLIVDDEPGVLDIASTFLEREGCEATTTVDAKTALGIIEEREIDFVISTANPHIEKPFSLEELKKAIISVLG